MKNIFNLFSFNDDPPIGLTSLGFKRKNIRKKIKKESSWIIPTTSDSQLWKSSFPTDQIHCSLR